MLAWHETVGQWFPMSFAFESLPLATIVVSFAVGFVAGILIYPLVRVIQDRSGKFSHRGRQG